MVIDGCQTQNYLAKKSTKCVNTLLSDSGEVPKVNDWYSGGPLTKGSNSDDVLPDVLLKLLNPQLLSQVGTILAPFFSFFFHLELHTNFFLFEVRSAFLFCKDCILVVHAHG